MTEVPDILSKRRRLKYIYNSYRTALLNQKYFWEKLREFQRYNSAMEIAIAIGTTSGGGVAGLSVWNANVGGHIAWLAISGVAAVLGVIKPILQLSKHIERYTGLYTGYTNVYLDLKSIVEELDVSQALPSKIVAQYETIRKRIQALGERDTPRPNEELIRTLQAQVNAEIPPDSLWYP